MPRNVLKTGMAITVSGNSINIGSPELIVCVIFGKIRKAPIIIPTKGSNPNAFADNYIPIYQKFGLNKTEIEIISKATKKKEYYYKSTKGSRLFELDLKKKTLSLIASSDLPKQNKAKELKEIYRDANDFTREWLSYGESI